MTDMREKLKEYTRSPMKYSNTVLPNNFILAITLKINGQNSSFGGHTVELERWLNFRAIFAQKDALLRESALI